MKNKDFNKIKQMNNAGILSLNNNNLNYSIKSLKKELENMNINMKSIVRYHYVKTIDPAKSIKKQIKQKHINANKNLVKFVKSKFASAPKLKKTKVPSSDDPLMQKIEELEKKEAKTEALAKKRLANPKYAKQRLMAKMREYKARNKPKKPNKINEVFINGNNNSNNEKNGNNNYQINKEYCPPNRLKELEKKVKNFKKEQKKKN